MLKLRIGESRAGQRTWRRSARGVALAATGAGLLLVGGPLPGAAAAERWSNPTTAFTRVLPQEEQAGCPHGAVPDVALDVPNLSIDEAKVDIENLKLRLDVDARLGNLLSLHAGVDVSADKINLELKGVQAEAHLKVCLSTVEAIIDRTLTTVDNNPQILDQLLGGTSNLLSQSVNQLGQTVLQSIDSAGNIIEQTVDQGGRIAGQRTVGNISTLPVIAETTNSAGQIVRRLQHPSGGVIEAVYDRAGNLLSTRVVSQGFS